MKMSWSGHKIYRRARQGVSQGRRISSLKNVCKILTCHLNTAKSESWVQPWLFQGTRMCRDWAAPTTTSFLSSQTSRPLWRLPRTHSSSSNLRLCRTVKPRPELWKLATLLWRQANLHVITPDSRWPHCSSNISLFNIFNLCRRRDLQRWRSPGTNPK